MLSAVVPFGKFKGQQVRDVKTAYLKWLLTCENLEPWLRTAVKAELRDRGERFLPAATVLADLQDELDRLVNDEGNDLDRDAAAVAGDLLLDAVENVKQMHNIGRDSELVIPGRRPMLCPACQGRIGGVAP